MIRFKADGNMLKRDLNGIIKAVFDGLYDYEKEMANIVSDATGSWKRPVKFTVKRDAQGGGDIRSRHPYFKYVDEGTNSRYVKLSRDWRSKSSVHSLSMGSGSGRVLRQTSVSQGHIKAREFWYPANQIAWPHVTGYITTRLRQKGFI